MNFALRLISLSWPDRGLSVPLPCGLWCFQWAGQSASDWNNILWLGPLLYESSGNTPFPKYLLKKRSPREYGEEEFKVENSCLLQAKGCCRKKWNLNGSRHRDLFSCFWNVSSFVSRVAMPFVVTESPQDEDSWSHHFHLPCRGGKGAWQLHITLEGFHLKTSLPCAFHWPKPVLRPCLILDWRNAGLRLPRRRNGMFENSLMDHNTTPLSTLLVMRLWGNEQSFLLQRSQQPGTQPLTRHTLDSWEIPFEKSSSPGHFTSINGFGLNCIPSKKGMSKSTPRT